MFIDVQAYIFSSSYLCTVLRWRWKQIFRVNYSVSFSSVWA